MRFDVISTFPEFFSVLDLSLVGKARDAGILDIEVHNLRNWATGKHLSVDESPSGGGAGMVMRADVWGHAIDDVISEGAVLAIPTPSGAPLTQRDLERLSAAKQIVIACGRYEGIDARVAEHYRTSNVEVFEYSLGDYVLNGGEVAAIALVEGVSRLVEGVVGNPESLAEESHSAEGLLEYPVYTLPRSWRGLETPAVLFSGDHSRIRRWRRDQALSRTAARRPDMIEELLGRGAELDRDDSEVLTARGIDISGGGGGFTFEVATSGDIAEVADLAARTFPLACPPGTTQSEIEDHVATHLSVDALHTSVEDGARITIARSLKGGAIAAYALIEERTAPDLPGASERTCYLSKIYSDPNVHGTGVAGALLDFALTDATAMWGSTSVALGTNRANKRAIRFYRNHGFKKVGRRTFDVGGRSHSDFVYVRDLTQFPPR